MNKITGIYLFFIFLASNLAAQNCGSDYLFENQSHGFIIVDGKLLGRDSVRITLSKGTHIIAIKKNIYEWDGNTILDTITVKGCNQPRRVRYNLPGISYINSNPQDAAVYNFKKLIGYTPALISKNLIDISLKKKNFFPKQIDSLSPVVNVKLIPEEFHQNKEEFTQTPWFKVLLLSAAGFGATAAYFKLKADKRFDKYKETKESVFLNQTDKFDLYSGIALSALEINIGVLIYYFLFD